MLCSLLLLFRKETFLHLQKCASYTHCPIIQLPQELNKTHSLYDVPAYHNYSVWKTSEFLHKIILGKSIMCSLNMIMFQ